MLLSPFSVVLTALALQVAAAPAGDSPLAITAAPTPTSNAHCPTITKTGTICQTCPIPMCIMLSTVSNPCGCPTAIPTAVVDFPCGSGCHIGCSTAYTFAPSPTCHKSSTAACAATVSAA